MTALSKIAFGAGEPENVRRPKLKALLDHLIAVELITSDPEIAALAALVSAPDTLPYFTGSGAAALASFTAAVRAALALLPNISGNAATATKLAATVTNGDSVVLPIGTPVYLSAADTIKRGKADSLSTAKLVGLVAAASLGIGASGSISNSGLLTATTAQWDAVAGTSGGLTANADYFLDPLNAGKITATVPTAVGQCVAFVGTALSATELDIQLARPVRR